MIFYLHNFIRNIKEKPAVYILIFLSVIVSIAVTEYFWSILKELFLYGGFLFYFPLMLILICLCCINVAFLFIHLTYANAYRYNIYQACGASHRQIAAAAFVDGLLVAMLSCIPGYFLGRWLIPEFTQSLGGKQLEAWELFVIFAMNIVIVSATYILALYKTGGKYISTRAKN